MVREERSQGLRGRRLNQCPLLSVRTLSSWSLAWIVRCGDGAGDEVKGMSPMLSRCVGGQDTDKEVDAGGLAFVVSLFITIDGVDATAGSEVLSRREEDVTVATGIPKGLPFCFTRGLSLPCE